MKQLLNLLPILAILLISGVPNGESGGTKGSPNGYASRHTWKKNHTLKICIDATNVLGNDKVVIVKMEHPRTGIINEYTLPMGHRYTFQYKHRGTSVNPIISVSFGDGIGDPQESKVGPSEISACGPGASPKDKVSSTSSQSSTVLVTIDE